MEEEHAIERLTSSSATELAFIVSKNFKDQFHTCRSDEPKVPPIAEIICLY